VSNSTARRQSPRTARLVALSAGLCLLTTGCEWFTDFKQQPSVGPWQHFSTDSAANRGFRGNPAGSVPTTGSEVPGFVVSYANLPATIDSLAGVRNPVAPDARSIANGHKYYAINCAVCHGDLGDGNGTLRQANPTYSFAPSLLTDLTKNRSDGYIWGMIRNGRATMPSYNRIEEMDRWDVVNYVRGLQGKLGAPVATGPVGLPGETGDKLPGATRMGPTVPAAYAHQAPAAMTAVDRKPESRP
jgi:mono/diheme cytochrome c family protein